MVVVGENGDEEWSEGEAVVVDGGGEPEEVVE